MLNLFLVLLIAGGLSLFALQNLAPIPLVIFGQTTLSLPLAIWILVAIAAGVVTSLLIAGLYKASNSVASRRAAPRRGNPRQSVFVGRFSRSARSSDPGRSYAPSPDPGDRRPADDDWETPSDTSDDWDDWDAYEEPRQTSRDWVSAHRGNRTPRAVSPDPPLYDADYRTVEPYDTVSYAAEDGPFKPVSNSSYAAYGDRVDEADPSYPSDQPRSRYSDPSTVRPDLDDDDDDDGPEEWDDWDGYEEKSASSAQADDATLPYTGRTNFEVKQEPQTAHRSGTIYSYSYRKPSDDDDDDDDDGKQESVYRSSQPIITPPPASEPGETASAPPEAMSSNDDDWGLDEGFDHPNRRR